MGMSDFINTFTTDENHRSWYIMDWSLPQNCPEVFGPPPYRGFIVPKYFSGDYFQRVPYSIYKFVWPSLFVGSEETESGIHVDRGGLNFWMYLLSGRKKWRFFSRKDLVNIYSLPGQPHFFPDIFDYKIEDYPLMKYAELYEVDQEPGDLIFVPSESPHGVRNLEAIHGVSMNYVDETNLWRYLRASLFDHEMFDLWNFVKEGQLPNG